MRSVSDIEGRSMTTSASTWAPAAGSLTRCWPCLARWYGANPSNTGAVGFASLRLCFTQWADDVDRRWQQGGRAAGRDHGLGFISQTASPGLKEYYEAQCRAHGHEPGMIQFPQPGAPTAVFVADDVDEAWDELGPHLLHDAKTAASYRPHDDSVASITRADSVAALRKDSGPYRIFTSDEAIDYVRGGQLLPLASALRRPCTRCGVAVSRTRRGRRRAGPRQ